MATVNINILGIGELKWTGMHEFQMNSDDHYVYYCGQESLRRNALCSMSVVSFNITVIQVYALTSNEKKLKLNGSVKTYKTF